MIATKPPEGITPTLVKQYAYCPVIVWLKAWFMLEEPATDSMRVATEVLKPPEGKGQVIVRSSVGSTIIDEVVENGNSKILVERKAYSSHNHSRYVEQAVASYLVARTRIPGIRKVRLEVAGETRVLELSEDLVNEVEKLVEKTREILERETGPPKPGNPRKCTSCWYKRYCPYW